MHMLEDGYSINYVHTNYGINEAQLSKLWFLYQKKGAKALHRQEYTRSNATFRHKVVLDIENINDMAIAECVPNCAMKGMTSTTRLCRN